MKQFHCKKCKRTWKTGEEDKSRIVYSDGICADCAEFIEGCKRGIKARKAGDRIHWNDVKEELDIT